MNVPIGTDLPLFLDPFAISLRSDPWSRGCTHTIQYFFQQIVDLIRAGDRGGALRLLGFLREPNETHLGLSRGRPQGAGIGSLQAEQLYDALEGSAAVQTGFLRHLEEAELLIPGIGRDKISDLTTNIIRSSLAQYTLEQCQLLDIPTQQAALPPYYSIQENGWVSEYFQLPVTERGPLLLVPKASVRYHFSYDHQRYYREFVVDFLRAEALEAGSSLVQVLKNGNQRVYKKDVKAKFPLTKEFLFEFSKAHPEVLGEYRDAIRAEHIAIDTDVDEGDQREIAVMLSTALEAIQPGSVQAAEYHRLMVGVMEFLFFPHLMHPAKEREIHEGRKRIDIVMENSAREGASLHALHAIKHLPCSYVPIECKNYVTEIANPELDQLAGRFSVQRGKFGILACRHFEDREQFVRRCRDTFQDDRGLIIALDDRVVQELLELVARGRRRDVDVRIRELVGEIWVS